MVMNRFFLLIAVLLAQPISAQVFRGESELFGLEKYVPHPKESTKDVLGWVRYYIGEKGGSTYIVISIPHSTDEIEISRNNNVYIEYANKKYSKTQVHSTETNRLSKPYSRDKLFETLVECPVDESELCKRRIKKICIETDNDDEYEIEVEWYWGTFLNKMLPTYFTEAKKSAEKRKERKEFLTDTFGEKIPENIKKYLEEKFPEQSYNLIQLDTVYMPFRSIALLEYAIKNEIADLIYKSAETEEGDNGYSKLIEKGDSIVKEFKDELARYVDEFETIYAAEGGNDDYQRAVIEIINYNGKEKETLYTRVGEENPTEFDFRKTEEECNTDIKELEELVHKLRKKKNEKIEKEEI